MPNSAPRHGSARPPNRRRRWVAVLSAAAITAGVLLGAPVGATAATGPDLWSAYGPDATLTSTGAGSPASFSYDLADQKRTDASWLFVATAGTTGAQSLPWSWTGDHGRSDVRSRLTTGVYRNGSFRQIAVLVDDGPRDCCPPGTTGFRYSGTTTLDLEQGDRYGFLLTASHTEKTGPLRGTFTLVADPSGSGPEVTVPEQPVTATIPDDQSGAVVTFPATAHDPVDGELTPTCTPASGSEFPAGDTEVTCTATNSRGMSSSAQLVVRVFVDEPNLAWPTATTMTSDDSRRGTLRLPGQALWYRFPVQPDSTVEVELTELAANGDLTLFGDIGRAFDEALTTRDLDRLGAEFAADAFSPSAFSPSAFSPSAFSPSAFSPSAFSPSAFSPSAFSPSAFSPSAFSPSAFSPSAFSPSAFSPSAFSPAVSLPSAFSPSAFSPSAFSPEQLRDAFSSAQVRSLIAVSARDGVADENIRVSTWDATGYFYVRVQGRNGAAAPGRPFRISVTAEGGACAEPLSTFTERSTLVGTPGAARTVILTDSTRLPGVPLEALQGFADRADVQGVVVDAGTLPRLQALNAQADDQVACPYAKNLVAEALREVVDSYRDDVGTLRYVVLAGDDGVIPFFRTADAAGLGPEQGYVPPVADSSSSQAALRRNQVLSQDAYGADVEVHLKGATVAVPDLAVGRLVETPAEIRAALQRYADLDGRLPAPTSALVTGYDFLTDGADEVSAALDAGLGAGRTTDLITDGDVPPSTRTAGQPDRRHSWTADNLRAELLGERHDIVYLAGHFSANSALAADYETSLVTTEVRDSATADLENTLVLSAGCHSGYNIVDPHAVPGLTERLDWPQVMADEGAVLIAGTGYQYGDTDFVEYSERLYAGVTSQLRVGTGPVALGSALVRAKQDYLATTPVLSGIHQKALAEATLYGLPMLSLDLPHGRLPEPDAGPHTTQAVATGPGAQLGLRTATVRADGSTTVVTQAFTDPDGTGESEFTYLEGVDGTVTSPGQPALPLQSIDVGAPGYALRGVGFRGGTYTDTPRVVPLTGAPTTETHEVHTAFSSPVFFPRRLATANPYGALAGDGGTRLLVTPAQHRSDSPVTSTLRRYGSTDFELLYSNNTQTYGDNVPALAGPPEITGVTSTVSGSSVAVSVDVVGDPSAGIQQVWVTRTAEQGPWHGAWSSLDLTQSSDVSTRWTGTLTLPPGQQPADVRFIVQAANGVGLVSVEDNEGQEFVPGTSPGLDPAPSGGAASQLSLAAPATGVYGGSLPVQATLSAGPAAQGVDGAPVRISLGSTSRVVTTDSQGVARTTFPLVQQVGQVTLSATFDGDARVARSTDQRVVTVQKRPTELGLAGPEGPVSAGQDTGVVATLTTGGTPVTERAVLFVARQDGSVVAAATRTTQPDGRARLGSLGLPSGTVSITAYFGLDDVDVGDGHRAGSLDPENLASTSSPVSVRVLTAPRVLTETLPDAVAGLPYDQQVAVEGDPTPEVSVSGLPEGLTYADGRLRGTTTTAGRFPVVVTAENQAGRAERTVDLVVRAGAPATVTPVSGSGQSARFDSPFAHPLVARVVDAYGNPVAGAEVTFASPTGGASTSPARMDATTGPDGLASVSARANSTVGGYDVAVRTGSLSGTAFRLANAYDVGPFAAPYDAPPGSTVTVDRTDPVNLSFRLADAAGPISDAEGLRLWLAPCRVRFVHVPDDGASAEAARCMSYNIATHRFGYQTNGALLGWVSGRTYTLRVVVDGERAGDLLGTREVRVRVR